MKLLAASAATVDFATAAVALAPLALILLWPKVTKRIPGTIVALVAATVATQLFHLPVATIGTRFGGIPTGLPHFQIPEFRPDLIPMLAPSALTVALLGAIESLLSAVVGDNLSGGQHDSNTELVAQGVANLATPLFGGIPATGAIARTATNIRSGARTPVAGIVHAFTLLFILLVAAPLARFVPLATLAAVLLVVAYNMGEWREIGYIMRLAKTAIAVWGVTFLLTVFADLTVAVEFGIVLAALLYIYRISETTTVSLVTDDYLQAGGPHALQGKNIPDYVTIVRIHGPFLFGSTAKLTEATADINAFAPS
jgi:sulfate permease, SulP family